jgi:hypothetical protein
MPCIQWFAKAISRYRDSGRSLTHGRPHALPSGVNFAFKCPVAARGKWQSIAARLNPARPTQAGAMWRGHKVMVA